MDTRPFFSGFTVLVLVSLCFVYLNLYVPVLLSVFNLPVSFVHIPILSLIILYILLILRINIVFITPVV